MILEEVGEEACKMEGKESNTSGAHKWRNENRHKHE